MAMLTLKSSTSLSKPTFRDPSRRCRILWTRWINPRFVSPPFTPQLVLSPKRCCFGDASNAIIIGFGVRPDAKARLAAERDGVEIRTYSVIYKAIEDIDAARIGMLKPTEQRYKQVSQMFEIPLRYRRLPLPPAG